MTACHTISPAVADDDSFFVEPDDEEGEHDEEVGGEEDEDLSVINVNRRCELPFVFLQ